MRIEDILAASSLPDDPKTLIRMMQTLAQELMDLKLAHVRAHRALSEPKASDAALNLMGVLEDMRNEGGDPVCIRTIDRVIGQIVEAQRALAP